MCNAPPPRRLEGVMERVVCARSRFVCCGGGGTRGGEPARQGSRARKRERERGDGHGGDGELHPLLHGWLRQLACLLLASSLASRALNPRFVRSLLPATRPLAPCTGSNSLFTIAYISPKPPSSSSSSRARSVISLPLCCSFSSDSKTTHFFGRLFTFRSLTVFYYCFPLCFTCVR